MEEELKEPKITTFQIVLIVLSIVLITSLTTILCINADHINYTCSYSCSNKEVYKTCTQHKDFKEVVKFIEETCNENKK